MVEATKGDSNQAPMQQVSNTDQQQQAAQQAQQTKAKRQQQKKQAANGKETEVAKKNLAQMFQSIQSQYQRQFDTTVQTRVLEDKPTDANPSAAASSTGETKKRTYKKKLPQKIESSGTELVAGQSAASVVGVDAAAAGDVEEVKKENGKDEEIKEGQMMRQKSNSDIRMLDKDQVKEVTNVLSSEEF